MTVREFMPADYESLTELHNLVYPDYPTSVAAVRSEDDSNDPTCYRRRWLAEVDGRLVGVVMGHQTPWLYHPEKFMVDLGVHPAYRRRGIGGHLYARLMDELKPYNPMSMRTFQREDMVDGVRFLTQRGYEEEKRDWESRLQLDGFDLSPYADVDERPTAHGIRILPISEMTPGDDLNRRL